LFTRETHQSTIFKLEGKHAPLDCVKCHAPEGKEAVYVTGKLLCKDCHTDPHGGEFSGPPYADKCGDCHTQNGFEPSTFSFPRHSQSKFALTGAHAAVVCGDCHKPLAPDAAPAAIPDAGGYAARQYHFASETCAACHSDPHHTDLSCETCHNVQQWRELRTFDHGSTRFALEGAHQTVTCVSCHRPTGVAGK
jgi:hypothetical protein